MNSIATPQTQLNVALLDLENQKQNALKNIQSDYYNSSSPAYGDNNGFSWAVDAINKKYNELKADLVESYME